MFQISNPLISSKLQIFQKNNLDRMWLVLPKNELQVNKSTLIMNIGN